MPLGKNKIFCDETWNVRKRNVHSPYFVFYGVLVTVESEALILKDIRNFRIRRGLSDEIKWTRVEKENYADKLTVERVRRVVDRLEKTKEHSTAGTKKTKEPLFEPQPTIKVAQSEPEIRSFSFFYSRGTD